MKIDFDDGGYIEISRASGDNLYVIVAARNSDRTKTVNSAQLSRQQLEQLLGEVDFSLPAPAAKKKTKRKTTRKKTSKTTSKPKPKNKEDK